MPRGKGSQRRRQAARLAAYNAAKEAAIELPMEFVRRTHAGAEGQDELPRIMGGDRVLGRPANPQGRKTLRGKPVGAHDVHATGQRNGVVKVRPTKRVESSHG
jgi:hypothetical protein